MRTATEDYELRGQRIKAGDKVVMFYASANRDEEVFADPFEFRVERLSKRFEVSLSICSADPSTPDPT